MLFVGCRNLILFVTLTAGFWSQAQSLSCENLLIHSLNLRSGAIKSIHAFDQLLHQLKQRPELEHLYSELNENTDTKKISIEAHTRDVFKQFLIESKSQTPISPGLLKVLPMTIALHDIGKPLAIRAGQRDLQHVYTAPMVRTLLKENGWPPVDIEKCIALITFSGFGDLLKSQKSVFDVLLEIHQISRQLNVRPIDFFNAKKAFYLSDAGAYEQLRNKIFKQTPAGSLDPFSEKLDELEHWLRSDI